MNLRLKRSWYLQQNNNAVLGVRRKTRENHSIEKCVIGRKSTGKIGTVLSMFFILFLIVLGAFQLQFLTVIHASTMVENALTAAELACALVDLQKLGKTGEVRITDEEKCFHTFEIYLQKNLQKPETVDREKLLAGEVQISEFRIYNVSGNDITESIFDGSGRIVSVKNGYVGDVYSPDGVRIENTSVYGKITFAVPGMNHMIIPGKKEKTVDIQRTE